MRALHRAALKRAYRTLAQGLGGSAVTTALVAVTTDGQAAGKAAVVALVTVGVTAFASFWQGVAKGLPEVDADAAG